VAALNERLAAVSSELSTAQALNQRDSDRIAELQEDYNALLKRSPDGNSGNHESNKSQYAAQIEDLVAERDATQQQVGVCFVQGYALSVNMVSVHICVLSSLYDFQRESSESFATSSFSRWIFVTASKVEELSRRLDERDSEPEVASLQKQLSTANASASRLETEV